MIHKIIRLTKPHTKKTRTRTALQTKTMHKIVKMCKILLWFIHTHTPTHTSNAVKEFITVLICGH